MKIIILAAGTGCRFNFPTCNQLPKCLITINSGRSILDSNLQNIVEILPPHCQTYIVTGFKHALIEDFIAGRPPENSRVHLLFNPEYADSVIKSVRTGFQEVTASDTVLLLNGDTVFSKEIFHKVKTLLDNNFSKLGIIGTRNENFLEDDIRLLVDENKYVRNIGKSIYYANALSSGAIFIGKDGLPGYMDMLHSPKTSQLKTHHSILQLLLDSLPVYFLNTRIHNWHEIDTVEDLNSIHCP